MITIVGAGKVGGAAALFTALRKLSDEILLLDIVQGLPQGEAMDLNHTLSEQGIDVNIRGSNDYSEMKGSDIVVVVAGSGRKPGMTRMDLLKINTSIVKGVVENIKKYASDSMIIPVTNPLDPMTYLTYKVSGFQKNKVFGMGNMLDLSRFIQFIHEETGMSRYSIRAIVIGEHGENMLPLARYSSVSGIPLTLLLSKQKIEALIQNTRQVAAKVIELKGATVHAPGNAIANMVEAVVRDTKEVIPVTTCLDGQYGYSDVAIGVPAIIGKGGVEKILELELDANEKEWFKKGIDSVKNAISTMEF
ncbi:MAG: malate dehydrogenase [Nitrosopumilaceae archaeon]